MRGWDPCVARECQVDHGVDKAGVAGVGLTLLGVAYGPALVFDLTVAAIRIAMP